MNNEQQKAKELAKLLNAFADGKQLEYQSQQFGWCGTISLEYIVDSVINSKRHIRIKPETKRVKLTMQDMVDRIKENKTLAVDYKTELMDFKTITNWEYFNEVGIKFIGFYELSPFEDLINMNFADGTPCSKEVECE